MAYVVFDTSPRARLCTVAAASPFSFFLDDVLEFSRHRVPQIRVGGMVRRRATSNCDSFQCRSQSRALGQIAMTKIKHPRVRTARAVGQQDPDRFGSDMWHARVQQAASHAWLMLENLVRKILNFEFRAKKKLVPSPLNQPVTDIYKPFSINHDRAPQQPPAQLPQRRRCFAFRRITCTRCRLGWPQ